MMDSLVRKYLDGELSETEALAFLEDMDRDPGLSREVAALEEVVALGSAQPEFTVSPQFTNRVMATIGVQSAPVSPGRPDVWTWSRRLPMAASWVLAIGVGYFLAAGGLGLGPDPEPDSAFLAQSGSDASAPGAAAMASLAAASSPQVVRLVYATTGRDVGHVGVAGNFNNWNPAKTPMRLENGVWVAMMLLPPDSYEYMFVEDNTTWVTDPLALTTRDDGFGSQNAVLEIGI